MARKLTKEQHLERAHIKILNSKQFALLAGVLMVGDNIWTDDVATAATDGRNSYYNERFMLEVLDGEKQFAFVVVHEQFHKMLQHLVIWKKLDQINRHVCNMACDYVINLMIRDLDPTGEIVEVPESALIDDKFRGWDTEQVFNELMKNPPDDKGGCGGDGQPLDDHQWDKANGMSAEEREQLGKDIERAIRQGEIFASKVGGGSARDLGALPEPKANWREHLRDFANSLAQGKDLSTWRRPNRRWLGAGTYMPSHISERIGKVVIGIDTSGSISNDIIAEFLAEVTAIAETVKPETIDLLYWDTSVAAAEQYDEFSYPTLATSTKPAGGGGTLPMCVADYMRDENLKPEAVIMLSDGCIAGDWPEFGVPTIWAMTTEYEAPNAKNIHLN